MPISIPIILNESLPHSHTCVRLQCIYNSRGSRTNTHASRITSMCVCVCVLLQNRTLAMLHCDKINVHSRWILYVPACACMLARATIKKLDAHGGVARERTHAHPPTQSPSQMEWCVCVCASRLHLHSYTSPLASGKLVRRQSGRTQFTAERTMV